jgi:hypothetical protein
MRLVALVSTALMSGSAFAVSLKYDCSGLWAAPFAVLNGTAAIEGEFAPTASNLEFTVHLDSGAKLSGTFRGSSSNVTAGTLSLSGDSLKIDGTLIRIVSDGLLHDGFRFEGSNYSSVLSCHLVK